MALDIAIKSFKNVPVLELTGRIIDVDVKKFSRRLDALYKKKFPKVIVDLSRTNFIDSQGLGVLVYHHSLMQREGRELIILNANSGSQNYIARLFELTNLNKVMPVAASIDAIAI